MNLKIKYLLLVIYILVIGLCNAQEYKGDPDISLKNARELAFQGQRKAAIDTLNKVIPHYPDYIDLRLLLGSIYSWDNKHQLARKQFEVALKTEKKYKELWIAAINNELYDKEYQQALDLIDSTLTYFPKDLNVDYKKVQVLDNLGETDHAIKLLDTMINTQKNNNWVAYRRNLYLKSLRRSVFIGLTGETFSDIFDNMGYANVGYSRETKFGTFIGKINYANRFDTEGLQYEFEGYPKFGKKIYAYLNYAYSNSPIFPKSKWGGELFVILPKNMEASLGYRQIYFDNDGGITTHLLTGSVSKHLGSYFVQLRPFLSYSNGQEGFATSLSVRKYLKNDKNYIGTTIAFGATPQFNRFSPEGTDFIIVNSSDFSISYNFIVNRNVFTPKVNISRQELSFDEGNYIWVFGFGINYSFRYR